MMPERLRQAVDPVLAWAGQRPDLLAVALVGSWARGEARADSDIDLVLLANAPATLRSDSGWPHEIRWASTGLQPLTWSDVDYGAAWSRHLQLSPDVEIELTFADPGWANTMPVDSGTLAVIADGFQILLDKMGALARLQASLQGRKR